MGATCEVPSLANLNKKKLSLEEDLVTSELNMNVARSIIDMCQDPNFAKILNAVEKAASGQSGIEFPKNFVFSGPPGTGKTFTAKILADALDILFIHVEGTILDSKWVGTSAKKIEDL